MKHSSLFTLSIMLLITLFTTAANATDIPANSINLSGNSNTRLGSYEIKELAAVTINGLTMRTFELSYKNAGFPVMIYLNERNDCRDYIVRSKNLEVKYVCSKSSFGAKLVTGKFRQYDPNLNARFLSRDEFAKQGMISEGGLEITSALGLIASYYPALFERPDLLD
jgi:hypothetical protein